MNKRELVNLLIGSSLIVVLFIVFVGDGLQAGNFAQWYATDLYADHYHVPSQPSLHINHTVGKPGSYFYLWGYNYPALSTATIAINTHILGTVSVGSTGDLYFELSTLVADEGEYQVNVFVNPSASTRFTLTLDSPNTWPQVSASMPIVVPAGIALKYVYLPLALVN